MSSTVGSKRFLTILFFVYLALIYPLANGIYDLLRQLLDVFFSIVGGGELKFALHLNMESFFQFHVNSLDEITGYIVIYAILLYGYGKFAYHMRNSFGSISDNQYGDNRFTELDELKKQYRAVPESKLEFKGSGGVPISHINYSINKPYKYLKQKNIPLYKVMPNIREKFLIDDSPVNNLIIGTTRSGKGQTFVISTVDIYSRAKQKASMVINDPKGELAAASKETLEKRGYDVHILNLLDQDASMSYNPLQLVIDAYKEGDHETATTLANTFSFSLYNDPNAKDPFWNNAAISLCNALILAVTADCIKKGQEHKVTIYTVANMLSTLGGMNYTLPDGTEVNELDQYFQKRPATDPGRLQYATSNFAKGNTRSSIFSTTMSKLQVFINDKTAKLTSKNSLRLKDVGFGDKPIAIFMVTPDYDKSLHSIPSVFVRQLNFILAKEASLHGGKCTREVIFLLDEFGNMIAIDDMAGLITVCLGRNIRFNLVIQAYNQVDALYGEDSKTIFGNCGNQIYILTGDDATADKFSKLIGTKTITDKSRSGKHLSFEKTESESARERALLLPSELMNIKEEESVVVRVIKRTDLKGRDIVSYPIFNTGKTRLKSSWKFLLDDFDTRKDIRDIKIESLHKDVKLSDLLFDAKSEGDKLNAALEVLGRDFLEGIQDTMLDNAKYLGLSDDYLSVLENRFMNLSVLQLTALMKDAVGKGVMEQRQFFVIFRNNLSEFFTSEEAATFTSFNVSGVEHDSDSDLDEDNRLKHQQQLLANIN